MSGSYLSYVKGPCVRALPDRELYVDVLQIGRTGRVGMADREITSSYITGKVGMTSWMHLMKVMT